MYIQEDISDMQKHHKHDISSDYTVQKLAFFMEVYCDLNKYYL